MIAKEIDEIGIDDIQKLTELSFEPSRLELKGELKISSREDRREFLADVSSFANAHGGDIVYGVDEKGRKLKAIPSSNIDQLRLQMQQNLEDSIVPRFPFRIQPIETENKHFVIVIRVLKGNNGLYMIKKSNQFYYRSEAGKRKMDYIQIRNAFLETYNIKDEIREFIQNRVSDIRLRQTPAKIGKEAAVAIFVIPISTWNHDLGLEYITSTGRSNSINHIDASSGKFSRNFDGYVSSNHSKGYIQLFRNGCIENVSTSVTTHSIQDNLKGDITGIPTKTFDEGVYSGVYSTLDLLKNLKIAPPYMLFLYLLGAHNHTLLGDRNTYKIHHLKIEKEVLSFPEQFFDDNPEKHALAIKPWFDFLWQGFEFEVCPEYVNEKLYGNIP